MAKTRIHLCLTEDVIDTLSRHARARRLGSASQAAEQLLRQALFCQPDEYLEERVIPSIREAIREELAGMGFLDTGDLHPGPAARREERECHLTAEAPTPDTSTGSPGRATAR